MRVKFILFVLFLFWIAGPVLAGDAPVLSSPSNNSAVTSSTLNWQVPSYQLYSPGPSSPYRVQVDDNPGFSPSSSIYRDTYKSNTTYTPQLTSGTWYWRVKAKDVNGTWSNWSDIWSFTLGNATSTPTPSPTTIPTPSPSPTPSPTSSSTGSSSSSSFTISNIPSQINSDSPFTVSVNLSLPNNPSTKFYLKGAFKKPDGSNYFGFTKVAGSWVKNGSSYSAQYPITTDSSGNWSGNLEVQPDSEDSGFTGSGDYIFKVGRYKDSDNSTVTWSNESTIDITAINNSTEQSSETETSYSSTSEENPQTTIPSSSSKIVLSKKEFKKSTNYQVASVAGVKSSATPSAIATNKVAVKNQKVFNPFLLIGGVLIFAGAGSLGYIYLKRR